MKPCGHNHKAPPVSELAAKLRQKRRKVTGARQAVLKVLQEHQRPMSIREVHCAMRQSNCDLATVYRSIHLLEEMGMVKRFDFGEGNARYELLAEGDDGHHHHLVCTRCSDVVEIAECFSEELEQAIASRSGFKGITHRLEFFGVCPRCQ